MARKTKAVSKAEQWAAAQIAEVIPASTKALQQENKRLRVEIEQYKSGEAILKEALSEVWIDLPDLTYPPAPVRDKRKGLKPEIAVLHLSDLHFGKVTSSYGTAIAEDRMEILCNNVIEITNTRRGGAKIEELRIYLGGDIVEGDGAIFPKQAHKIDSSVLEQATITGPSILAKSILKLAEHFHTITIKVVSGNHGRPGSKHSSDHPLTCWDRVAYTSTKLMLLGRHADNKLSNRVEFHSNDDFYFVDTLFGQWGNMVIHGHEIRGGFAGYPWYAVGRKAMSWQTSIKDKWQYLYLGHFHTLACFTVNFATVLANGALETDNEYALQNMGAAGYPCQRLTFYDAKEGLISDNWVYVTNRMGD